MILRNPPIKAEDLAAGYGRKRVLSELSLEVPQGAVCALLGRNGAGKTTLLRVLLGFLKPKSGHVEVLGTDAWHSRFALKDRIGVVAVDLTGATVAALVFVILGVTVAWIGQRFRVVE
ncbi:MAG: ATP-binding cassette domain-containing protein [Acidobacteria bacterium]|nr:ATP-binding cassette domain-containing protein [Acidobacteriota bacterium]